MIDAPVALAFGTGMVATINPCGFAMLPAYLSYFLGMDDPSRDTRSGVLRALRVGLSVSAGFMVVFAAMGVLITKFSVAIEDKLPYVTMVIGVGIIVLGIAMLRGYEPTVALPKMNKGTSSRQMSSMFLFGVSYAVSSLSCTIPLFLALVSTTFTTTDFLSGFVVFLAYGAGMALVLMTLTLALALARQGIVHRMRSLLPHINKIAGGLLIVAGVYLVYFGWYELRAHQTITDPGGPAGTVQRLNDDLREWIIETGPLRIGIVLAGFLVVAVLLATSWGPRRGARRSS